MAWCHNCEEKKRNIQKTLTGEFFFNKKKETFKKFVERKRREKAYGFSFNLKIRRK